MGCVENYNLSQTLVDGEIVLELCFKRFEATLQDENLKVIIGLVL